MYRLGSNVRDVIARVSCVFSLCVFTFSVPLQFPHKNDVPFVVTFSCLFVGGLMSYLRYACLLVYGGVHHILRFDFCFVCLRFVSCVLWPVPL